MKIIHIDADRTGSSSVGHLIRSGHVETHPAPSLAVAARIVEAIRTKQLQGDLVVLDTVSALSDNTLADHVLDTAKASLTNLWDQRNKMTPSRDDYGGNATIMNRLLRAIYDLPQPSIIIAQQNEREDPLSGTSKYTPDAQGKILARLVSQADFIARLIPNPKPFEYSPGILVPVGTRLLITAATSDSAAGGRADVEHPIPPYIVGWQPHTPRFGDLVAALGYMPHCTVIYGPPKIGKTTFACSAVYQ